MKSLAEALEDHSPKFISMVRRQDRLMPLEHPDGYGMKKGVCGDSVEFFLKVENGIVQMAVFQLDGCFHTMACANTLSVMLEGKKVVECWDVTPENVIEYLESLPKDHHHCAELVVGAFYLALANYHEQERQPWKRAYSRG